MLTAAILVLGGGLAYRLSASHVQQGTTASAMAAPQANVGEAGFSISKPSPIAQQPELTSEELFKSASPSVVLIDVSDESGANRSTGSGFVLDNGAIVTNYHVIRGAFHGTVHFNDGTNADISGVLGHDSDKDLAILRLTENSAKSLRLGDSDQLQVGNKVFAIGSPKGLQNTISDGLVSGIRNGLIQTSTPISPGSSGGPFFNTHGEVVGIAVSRVLDAENLNLWFQSTG